MVPPPFHPVTTSIPFPILSYKPPLSISLFFDPPASPLVLSLSPCHCLPSIAFSHPLSPVLHFSSVSFPFLFRRGLPNSIFYNPFLFSFISITALSHDRLATRNAPLFCYSGLGRFGRRLFCRSFPHLGIDRPPVLPRLLLVRRHS